MNKTASILTLAFKKQAQEQLPWLNLGPTIREMGKRHPEKLPPVWSLGGPTGTIGDSLRRQDALSAAAALQPVLPPLAAAGQYYRGLLSVAPEAMGKAENNAVHSLVPLMWGAAFSRAMRQPRHGR